MPIEPEKLEELREALARRVLTLPQEALPELASTLLELELLYQPTKHPTDKKHLQ